MAHKASGKHHREGISLIEAVSKCSPTMQPRKSGLQKLAGQKARIVTLRVGQRAVGCLRTRSCPMVASRMSQTGGSHRNLHRSVKSRFQIWAIAVYLNVYVLKGVSSMKLHRDLGSRRRARGISMRLRKALEDDPRSDPSVCPAP